MIRILHYEYYIEILYWNIFLTFGGTDVLFESKTQITRVKYMSNTRWKTTQWSCSKTVMPVNRKMFIFKDFAWPQVHNIWGTAFSE